MKTVNTIAERDAIKNAVLFSLNQYGTWDVFETGDNIPIITSPKVFPSVSAWQIRKALNQMNLRTLVENAVNMSGDQNVIDGWNHATQFERYDPLVLMLANSLNKTSADLDNIWNLASSL